MADGVAVKVDPMQGRIARFSDIRSKGVPVMFIDSILPGHHRMNYAVIGDTASENPNYEPAVTAPHRFQVGMFEAPPGNGPAWHTHDYVEAFIPLTGRWRFYYGFDPERPDELAGEVFLEPWDLISFPPGLWRGFENVSETNAFGLGILDPHDPFISKDPHWPDWVAAEAAKLGLAADEKGKMRVPPNLDEIERTVTARIAETAVDTDG